MELLTDSEFKSGLMIILGIASVAGIIMFILLGLLIVKYRFFREQLRCAAIEQSLLKEKLSTIEDCVLQLQQQKLAENKYERDQAIQ